MLLSDNLNSENVGIIVLLESMNDRLPKKTICVATTHILFNPKRGDCKLAQLIYLLASIDRMAFRGLELNEKKARYHPTIICGDFNLAYKSVLYNFLRSSQLPNYREYNRCLMSGQLETSAQESFIEGSLLPESLGISDKSQFKSENERRLLTNKPDLFGGETLEHPFSLHSVYKHYNKIRNDYEITTCLRDSKKTVDYILYHSELDQDINEEELNLVARLELFHEAQVANFFLPSRYFPSDHFMLGAKFCLD